MFDDWGADAHTCSDMTSLYWSIMTISTVGYGDVAAHSLAEQAFAIFSMMIGTTLFGYVMGSAAAALTAAESTKAALQKKRQQLEAFLDDKKLPQVTMNQSSNFCMLRFQLHIIRTLCVRPLPSNRRERRSSASALDGTVASSGRDRSPSTAERRRS